MKTIDKSSWIGWFLLTCFCIFQFTLQGSVGIFADSLKETMHLDARTLSFLSSSFFYPYIFMQIPVGFIFDRYDIRKVSTLALCLVGVSLLLFAMSSTLMFAIFARILMGFACSFGFLGLAMSTARWFPPQYFAILIAGTECLGMLGVAGLNMVLSQLIQMFNWQIATLVCAFIAGLLSFCIFNFAPKTQTHNSETHQINLVKSLHVVVRYKEVWFGGFFAFATFAVITVFAGLWAIPFLMASAHLNLVQVTSVVSMIYIGSAVSNIFLGWLCGFVKTSTLMIPGSLLTIVLMLAVIYGPKDSLSTLYLLMLGLGCSCAVYQLPFIIVNKKIPEHVKGVAMGVTNIICMLSGPVLQPIIGFFLAASPNSGHGFESYPVDRFQTALLILPLSLIFSAFLAWRLREKQPIEETHTAVTKLTASDSEDS